MFEAAKTAFAALLAQRFDRLNVPGIAYAVVLDDRIAEAGGLGLRDVGADEPVTDTTPFRIASLTKPLAAALLLRAVAEGKAELDLPLMEASSRYRERCPEIKELFKREGYTLLDRISCGDPSVTVRTALTHTSRHPAGSEYSYNGFLFGVLGDYITQCLYPGASFEHVMRSEIIEPLALAHSAAGIADEKAPDVLDQLSPPHAQDDDGQWQVRPPLTDPLSAAAGLVSSARDLAQIDMAFKPGGLVRQDVWDRMTTPTELTSREVSPYGMGWFVQTANDLRLIWHYGWQPDAYSSLWLKVPERGATLILLANSDGLSRDYGLGAGDIMNSPMARWFLEWLDQGAAGEIAN